ncbi:MAG: hypothetical protein HY315_05645, partial [Acidobacteria bacterium]|nr:hypothetical protein [Acidobacteriota bacterium]
MIGSKKRLLFLLLLAAYTGRVWPHEGEDHTKDATLQTQTAGPNQLFQVSLAHLPDAPIAGQTVKFLARLEET